MTKLIWYVCFTLPHLYDRTCPSVGLSVRKVALFLYLYLFLAQGRIVGLWALFFWQTSFVLSREAEPPTVVFDALHSTITWNVTSFVFYNDFRYQMWRSFMETVGTSSYRSISFFVWQSFRACAKNCLFLFTCPRYRRRRNIRRAETKISRTPLQPEPLGLSG